MACYKTTEEKIAHYKNTLGDNVFKLRQANKESQDDLCEALGFKNHETVLRIEKNKRTTPIETIWKIADHYNVSIDYLLGRYSDPTNDQEIRDIVEKTGLSSRSIEVLEDWNAPEHKEIEAYQHMIDAINSLIYDSVCPYSVAEKYSSDPKNILLLIWEFLSFNGTEQPYKYSDGQIVPDEPVSSKPGDTKLNDRIIENAILMEIQQALFRVKDNLKAGEMDGKHQ